MRRNKTTTNKMKLMRTTSRKKMTALRRKKMKAKRRRLSKKMKLKRTMKKKMMVSMRMLKKMMQRKTSRRIMMLQRRKKKSLTEVKAQPLLLAQLIVLKMTLHAGSNSGNALIQFLVGMTLNLYHQLLLWALSVN